MKTNALLLLCSMSLSGLHAQSPQGTFSLIPTLGATLSNITNESVVFGSSATTVPSDGNTKLGVGAGIDLQYQMTPIVAVSVGAAFQQGGCTYHDSDLSQAAPGTYEVYQNSRTIINYLAVPLTAHIYVAQGLAVNIGLQPAFHLSNKTRSDISSVTIGKDGSYTYSTDIRKIDQENSFVRDLNMSIPVGISYEKDHVVVDARYVFGLSKIYKEPLDNNNRTRAFILSAGYKFDLFR